MNGIIFILISFIFFFLAYKYKTNTSKPKTYGSEKLEKLGKEYLKKLSKKYSKQSEKTEKKPEPQIQKPRKKISFTIIYGTQSGTSRRLSKDLCKESIETYHYNCKIKNASKIKSIEEFNNNSLLVFIFSTYGNGVPTDDSIEFTNMIENNDFWEKLTNKNLKYCIFGCGDSNYSKFNAQAKRLDKVFSKYFQSIIPLTLGDDSNNLEDNFDKWMIQFFDEIPKYFN